MTRSDPLVLEARRHGLAVAEAFVEEMAQVSMTAERLERLLDAVVASLCDRVAYELTGGPQSPRTALLEVAAVRAFYRRLAEMRVPVVPPARWVH